MLQKLITLTCAAVMFAGVSTAQTTRQQRAVTPAELMVRGTFEDPRVQTENIRVQLLNPSGISIQESFLDGNGHARFQVMPGNYRLRLTSQRIETVETSTFTIFPFMQMHTETVLLKLVDAQGQRGSGEHAITAAEMNIPSKARKEFDKGVKAMTKSDLANAEKHFQKAVEIYPDYAMAHNNLGVLALQGNDRAKGEAAFRKAMALGLNNGFVNVAKLATADGKYQEAEELLKKAIALNPANPEALLFMARAQIQLQKRDQALAHARRVHDFPHERFAISHLMAGSLLEELNQPAEALQEYKTFLTEAPSSPSADKVREAITFLEDKLAKAKLNPAPPGAK